MELTEFVDNYKNFCKAHFGGPCPLKSELPEYEECVPDRSPSCLMTVLNSPDYAEKTIHDWMMKNANEVPDKIPKTIKVLDENKNHNGGLGVG